MKRLDYPEGEELSWEALEEAREILKNDGRAEVREQLSLIEERYEYCLRREERLFYTHDAYRILVSCMEEREAGVVMEEVPCSCLVVVDRFRMAGRLWLAEDCLDAYGLPQVPDDYLERGVVVGPEMTWEEALAEARDLERRCKNEKEDVQTRVQRLHTRRHTFREVVERLAAGSMFQQEEQKATENARWTSGEKLTDKVIDLLSAYNSGGSTGLEEMNHLWDLLKQRGHEGTRSEFNSLQGALRRAGWSYQHGNPHAFIEALARALDEVGKLPKHLQKLCKTARSCKNLVDEAEVES